MQVQNTKFGDGSYYVSTNYFLNAFIKTEKRENGTGGKYVFCALS
jgi:hypothetical protein